jgi:hypothetical protein
MVVTKIQEEPGLFQKLDKCRKETIEFNRDNRVEISAEDMLDKQWRNLCE